MVLAGLGGVGKSSAAAEYAYRRADRHSVAWWLGAEEPVALAADFAALASPLDLPERNSTEQAVVIAAVRRWLERNPGWLLILDNAEGPEGIRGFLPRGGGRVLITSRSPA